MTTTKPVSMSLWVVYRAYICLRHPFAGHGWLLFANRNCDKEPMLFATRREAREYRAAHEQPYTLSQPRKVEIPMWLAERFMPSGPTLVAL